MAWPQEILTWVPVARALPDDEITVLCWLEPGGEWFAGYHTAHCWIDCATGGRLDSVTHWADAAGPHGESEAS